MSRLVHLIDLNPYEKFAWILVRSRAAMERAYLAAWNASDACNRLMRESHFVFDDAKRLFYGVQPVRDVGDRPAAQVVNELVRSASYEDLFCDSQAGIVVLFADDLLQTFGAGVLGRPIGNRGFGKTFNNGVHLTKLLRATTANIRHLSEWEAVPFPYPRIEDVEKSNPNYQPLKNIDILRRAFGVGESGPIRDISTWRALVTMDGLYGTHPPDYSRVERLLLEAAFGIADCGPPDARPRLTAELRRSESR